MPIYQHYGFMSVPVAGSGCVGVCNGSQDNLMILATKGTNEPSLSEGDVCLFSDGASIKLEKSGAVSIKAKKVKIESAKLKLGKNDLMGQVSKLVEILAQTPLLVATPSGPQPIPPNITMELTKIKAKIDSGMV